MRTLAAFVLLGVILSTPAFACSGTALADASPGGGIRSLARGQHYDDLDHLLRDPGSGQVLVCAGDDCYPAILAEHGHLTELLRLHGCRIAAAATNEQGMERHELDTPGFDRPPD